ncbi:hypothetical protein ACQ5SO_09815 [Rhodovulum sp. DZ06]|uniref:hypothetical protein n=1 Tax=Rhodovulum sp. DZ06 TaxID=3425126 RepID=UPI003D32A7AB
MRGSLWEEAQNAKGPAKGAAAERHVLTRARLRAADPERTPEAREDAAAAVELLEEREALRAGPLRRGLLGWLVLVLLG